MTHRPQCVSCSNRYGSRYVTIETVRWPKSEPIPPYEGNGRVVKVGHLFTLSRPQEIQRAATHWARARSELAEIERAPETPMYTTQRTIWDGVSYNAPYRPFCSLRCALRYARHAYSATQEAGQR